MKRGLLLAIVLALAVVPVTSAELFFTQPNTVYNVGDDLTITVTLQPNNDANDFLVVNLACSSGAVEVYRNAINLDGGEEKAVPIAITLDSTVLDGTRGACTLQAGHGAETGTSQEFEITDGIDVFADIDVQVIDPGQTFVISGTATKRNGHAVQGFVEARINDLDLSVTKTVSDGVFEVPLTVPPTAQPGSHTLLLRVFEEDMSGSVNNEGTVNEVIDVREVLTDIKIEVGSQNVLPGTSLLYTVNGINQVQDVASGDLSITLYTPSNTIYQKIVVSSGEEQVLEIGENFEAGYWKIEAQTGAITRKKLFYVEEFATAHFTVLGDTLIVTNTGNVAYEKSVEVSIGSGTEIVQMSIQVGEVDKFRLKAPDGEYDISVDDGTEPKQLGRVPLTGNAISIDDVQEGFVGLATSTAGLVLGGLILLLLIIIVYAHLLKRQAIHVKARGPIVIRDPNSPTISPPPQTQENPLPRISSTPTTSTSPKKEQSVHATPQTSKNEVDDGMTEEATILVIHVRSELSENNAPVLNQALSKAKKEGANIYVDGDYRIAIFSPLLTKKIDSSFLAITIASEIESMLTTYNAKAKEKIDFGIGVNTGQIISEKKHGKFTFMSRGSIIPSAKRLATSVREETLLSNDARKRMMSYAKTAPVPEKNGWRLVNVIDRREFKNLQKRL